MLSFNRLRNGLAKTRESLTDNLARLVPASKVDDAVLDDIEDALIQTDMGMDLAVEIIDDVRGRIRREGLSTHEALLAAIKEDLADLLETDNSAKTDAAGHKPHVVMVVGVNGTGKTTTIGKLAQRYRDEGRSVLMAAADTFRAAASEQLQVWADRADALIVRNQAGADPASVAFDAMNAAVARNIGVLIVDTAGRLHTKVNLMEELKKIRRVLEGKALDAPHEVLMVLDATTGQNGLNQAQEFSKAVGVTGLVLTKLDGTARGGVAFAVKRKLGIPIRYVGMGEGIGDLEVFDPKTYVEGLFN